MQNIFRLRYSDQQTIALVLSLFVGGLCYSATTSQEMLASKPFRFRVDINTATSGELQILPGIGPVLAEKIIQYRDQHVPISNIDDILNVKGIGNKKHQAIKHFFVDDLPTDKQQITFREKY